MSESTERLKILGCEIVCSDDHGGVSAEVKVDYCEKSYTLAVQRGTDLLWGLTSSAECGYEDNYLFRADSDCDDEDQVDKVLDYAIAECEGEA